jgi:hypothetical protein
VLDESFSLIDSFEHKGRSPDDLATQLLELAKSLDTLFVAHPPDAVVIREANYNTMAQREPAATRARGEGVAAATARTRCQRVTLIAGNEVGRLHGTNQATVDSLAQNLVPTEYVEAAGAAVAVASRLVSEKAAEDD